MSAWVDVVATTCLAKVDAVLEHEPDCVGCPNRISIGPDDAVLGEVVTNLTPTGATPAEAIARGDVDGRPYVWGGGHLSFLSKGYDCSGAVSYALHGAGLLETTMVSGQLAYWGEAGVGRWITVYANKDHVFMVVAGLRFDTRSDPPGVSGPRWKMAAAEARILPSFVARHPAGL